MRRSRPDRRCTWCQRSGTSSAGFCFPATTSTRSAACCRAASAHDWLWRGCCCGRRTAAARRTDQPSRSRLEGRAAGCAEDYGGTLDLRLARSLLRRAPGDARSSRSGTGAQSSTPALTRSSCGSKEHLEASNELAATRDELRVPNNERQRSAASRERRAREPRDRMAPKPNGRPRPAVAAARRRRESTRGAQAGTGRAAQTGTRSEGPPEPHDRPRGPDCRPRKRPIKDAGGADGRRRLLRGSSGGSRGSSTAIRR